MRLRLLVVAGLCGLLGAACPEEATAKPPAPAGRSESLSATDRAFLVDLARQTLAWRVTTNTIPELDPARLPAAVKAPLGCFVTLQRHDTGLRGCIGMFTPDTPLYENVITRAVAAAQHDSRFRPVAPEELSEIHVEISVLTTPRPLAYTDPADLLRKLIPGTHGVILKTRKGSSTYLPQVWEQLPDKEQFLSRLCFKHGSLATCWRDGPARTEVELYEAIVFGESGHGRVVVGPRGGAVGPGGAVYSAPPVADTARNVKPAFAAGAKLAPGTKLTPGTILAAGADLVQAR